jgi:adiponectin receptor
MSTTRQEYRGGAVMERCAENEDNKTEQEEPFLSPDSPPLTPSGSSRAGRLWQKVKDRWELVEFNALPDYLRDNEYIHRHYRPEWPIWQILLSTFTIHNETVNIWT